MYAGDGWAGKKVPGQSQDYTNTVQTERLRETLRKEQVRDSTQRISDSAPLCERRSPNRCVVRCAAGGGDGLRGAYGDVEAAAGGAPQRCPGLAGGAEIAAGIGKPPSHLLLFFFHTPHRPRAPAAAPALKLHALTVTLVFCLSQRGGWEGQMSASSAIGQGWEKTTLVNSENFLPPVAGFPSAYICKNARKKYF